MDWIASLLASGFVAAVVAGVVALLNSERQLAAENVIRERKDWREKIRKLAAKVYHAFISGESDENKFRVLRAKLALRLNPHDAEDQKILELVAPGNAARADEFNQRVSLLLKHDWERAKRDASLWRLACEKEPDPVRFEAYRPGERYDYTKWRWLCRWRAH
jgi:hypothetical protein